jgi:hypothetical protein
VLTHAQWTPHHRYNLTGDRSIPFTTYAKFVVDTATSLGQGGDKGFFKSQAQTHIAHALELLYELGRPVTLLGAFQLLSDRDLLEEEMENLESLLPVEANLLRHSQAPFLRDERTGRLLPPDKFIRRIKENDNASIDQVFKRNAHFYATSCW